jgi:DNA-binding NtrC family response regulator
LEFRQHLLHTLEALPADVTTCSTRAQAEEVLGRQPFEIIFCDEHLADGSYAELIHAHHSDGRIPRVVVTTRTGDWDLYFAALENGAFDVIRSPWHTTDVEWTIVRALREVDQQVTSGQAA